MVTLPVRPRLGNLVCLALLWLGASASAQGQVQVRMVATPTVEPAAVRAGVAEKVRIWADIGDPTVIATGVNLLKVGAPGTNPTVVGVLRDDGTGGDEIAGDGRFTIELTVSEPAAKTLVYRISAPFKGTLLRTVTPDLPLAVVANRAPVAVPGANQAVRTGALVQLDGRASYDLDGDLLRFRWTLTPPAGSAAALDSASLVKPGFTADRAGRYRVELVVNDGQVDSVVKEITVDATEGNAPPTAQLAALGLPFGAGPTASVPLIGSGRDPENQLLTYAWAIKARPATSTSAGLSASNATAPQLLADKPGRYLLELAVNDGNATGAPVQALITLYKPNTPPPVSAGADPASKPTGSLIALQGSASDLDGDSLVDVRWAFVAKPANSNAVLANPTTLTPGFTADQAGDYLLEMSATDNRGATGKARVVVRAVTLPPVTITSLVANPGSGTVPLTVNFLSQASGGSGSFGYGWTFGDNGSGSQQNPQHVYTQPGTYIATVTATDTQGSKGQRSVSIVANPVTMVTNQAPKIIQAAAIVTLPLSLALDPTVTDDGLPNPPAALTYSWSQVSGPAGQPPASPSSFAPVVFSATGTRTTTVTFDPTGPGTYVLRLTVSDGALATSLDITVTVLAQPQTAPAIGPLPNQTVRLGDTLSIALAGSDLNAKDSLTYNLLAAPSGASLSPGGSPRFTFTASAGQIGNHPVKVQVRDATNRSAQTSFNIVVLNANRAPQFTAASRADAIAGVGANYVRTLVATDPDAGDSLTYALVSGPAGLAISPTGVVAWSPSAAQRGDHVVKVKVTDGAGATDFAMFTLVVDENVAPIARDDVYEVRVNGLLTVNAASGVLVNDADPDTGGNAGLAARKLSDPSLGSVTSFSGDGSFSYQAPATPPGEPLTIAKLWNAKAGSDRYHELVADLNADGYPDIIGFDNNAGIRARSGRDGGELWSANRTGGADCQLNSGHGSMDSRVLADIDDSGHPSLVQTTYCSREGSNWHDNLIAFDHLGKVKWVSPPLSKPHPGIRRGATPVPSGGFTPGGVAFGRGLSVARLTAGGPPVLLMRAEIPVGNGYAYYVDAANAGHYAGCRAVTGLAADENVACRATFLISGTDGRVLQTLVARNPAAIPHYGGPGALSEMPPIAMDIDGDGRVDLVSGTEVWMQNASGGFVLAWQLAKSVNDTAVADLDGDGKAEIIHLRSSGESDVDQRGIFIYSHDGQLKRRIPLWTYWFTPLTIADVDGDGRSDIVVGGDGTVYAFRDDGRPIWAHKVPPDVPSNPVFAPFYTQPPEAFRVGNAAPQVYDLDGDGVAEVVVAGHSRIMILDGRTGQRKVDPYWTFNFSYNDVSALMLIDMNNDGHVDIVQNSSFIFNCLFVGADFLSECYGLVGPAALSGGGTNRWLPGPKAFPHVQYRSTAIDANARVLHDTKVSRLFRTPEQQGTVRDPRLAQATSFTYAAGDGAATSAPARVIIDIVPDNRPPVFTSVPPKSLWQRFAPTPPGGLVTNYYDVAATDPDPGDTVTFSLKSAPSWVTMSGPARIRFEPTCGSYGYPCPWGWTTVIVTATDSRGASTDQVFLVNLTTASVTVPNVAGMSFDAAAAALAAQDLQGVQWVQSFSPQPVGTVLAQDALPGTVVGRLDDIRLTVSKGAQPVALPFLVGQQLAAVNSLLTGAGLTVNVTTAFSPTVPAGEIMSQSPAFGTELAPATAPPVNLTVSAGGPLPAPVASIVLEPGPGPALRLAGDELQYKAVAILSDGTSADVTLTAAWSSTSTSVATVNTAGVAKAIAAGATTISASLSGKTGQGTLNVASRTLGDNTPPTAAITSPADGASVTGPTPIVGTASDVNFLRYELAIALAGDENYTVIGEGTSPVTNGTLGTLDPTVLVNDLYTLRLTVFDKSENQSVATRPVQLSGYRKIGLFTLTFQDLNVPAAGVPLTIHRTYDSRDKAQGDFGIGWRLGLQTLRLRANRVPGTGWVRVVSGPAVTLKPTSEHKVSVTLPDGKVEEFDMVVSPTSNLGSLDFTNVTGYQARPGTLGQLQALGNASLLIISGDTEDELVDDYSLETYAPKLYRYTTQDGTQIEISPTEGVKKVTDRNGNAVTFGPGGILHSDGRGIVFTRDTKGRIVAITDLNGNVQTYVYDGRGDLVRHSSAVGGVSTYTYDRHHGLIGIRDATGNQAVRNEYDAAGRLIAMIDAAGKRVEFAHNPGAQQELVTDRLGSVNRVVYDAAGNILVSGRVVTIEGVSVDAVMTMTYDAMGNKTSTIDPDGRTITATYAGDRLLGTVIDPSGANLATAFFYNARNDVTQVIDAGGRSYGFSYDGSGRLTGVTIPNLGSTTVMNNAAGQPIEQIDALGTRTVLTRDAAGRITQTDVVGTGSVLLRRIDTTWDPNGNKTSETLYRASGGVLVPATTRYAYDAANRLVAVTDPLGGVVRKEYDANGQVIAEVDPLGRRTTHAYNALGWRVRTTHPDGAFATVNYDAEGNEVATTDRAGRTTAHTYDELKRRVATTLPDGSITRTIYSPGGSVVATIDARGNRSDFQYDGVGRQLSLVLPAVPQGPGGALARPQYAVALNPLGQPVSRTDPAGRMTAFQYDVDGRLIRTTHPDGSSVQQIWDALGRRTGMIDEEGQATSYGYDALGRLVSVNGHAGVINYTYDEAGNLLTQTDALGRITRFRYDLLDRLIEQQYPGGETERWAYDAVGNLISRTDGLGHVTMFVYDEMDRETAKSLPGGVVIATTYLPDGRRATVTEPRGITSFAYDSAGRPGAVTHPAGEVVRYTHDASGNLLSITVPAATVSYGYDALDRLTKVSAPEGQTLTSFDLVGNVLRRTAANGIVSDAVFDVRNRPTLVTHRTAGGSALQSYSISWSPANRRSRITELDGSVESYSYDSRGRLQAELRTGTNPYSIAHVYDEVGNRIRTSRDGTSTQFTYDANDRMTADGTATLVWDANGNLVSRTQGSLVARYGFDPEDRLTSILDGGASHQFAYDGDGNRVRATTASGTTRFLVDDHNNTGLSQVLEERDGGGNLAARHTYGDSLLALVRGDASKVVLADPLGSVRALADVTGALTDRYQFDAYGNSIVVTGSTPNPYRYRGQRLEESGLYHLRARDYSPAQGRFLSRDPFAGRAAVPLSRHRYLYSNADPVNLVDPTGAEPNTLSLTVAQGISSAVDKALTLGYAVNKGCSAFSQLSFINNLVLWGTVSVSAATAFMGWGDLVGKTGITFFGVSPGAFGDDVKKAKFNVSYQSAADWTESWSAAISLKLANETGRSLTVGAKGLYGSASVNVWDKPITRCGLEIGKVALKAGAKAGASLHSGQITGLLSAEISFLDTFQFEYPIFELGGQVKNGKHSLVDKTFGRDATRHASRP